MKKLILLLVLTISFSTFAQEDFTRNYKKIFIKLEKSEDRHDGNITVVFKNNEVIVYGSTTVDHYYQVSEVEKGESTSGYKYQIIKCVVKETGGTVKIQLFDEVDTLRIIFSDAYVEFYN